MTLEDLHELAEEVYLGVWYGTIDEADLIEELDYLRRSLAKLKDKEKDNDE